MKQPVTVDANALIIVLGAAIDAVEGNTTPEEYRETLHASIAATALALIHAGIIEAPNACATMPPTTGRPN